MWRHVCLGALLASSLAGCSKILGIEDFALTPDAPPDVPGPDAQLCWGSGLAPVCITNPAMGVKTLDAPLDTDALGTCTDLIAQPSGPELCVIAGTQINVSNTVTATGTRPLMLLATDTINIGGTLDVSSKRTVAKAGAGANFGSCGAGTSPAVSSVASGGGAGGTFAPSFPKGYNGGDGLNSLTAVANGIAPAALGLTFVRGGCKGQNGGAVGSSAGGVGGSSGGAVYLFAATSITVAGNIYASGAGAGGPAIHAGGGGGGSGGLIGLEAPTIDVTGIVAANGGNGSAGGSTATGAGGNDGATMAFSTQPAAAAGANGAGAGGRGATGPNPATGLAGVGTVGGNATVSGSGGGGGGGATGVIWVKGVLTGTMVAPMPTLN